MPIDRITVDGHLAADPETREVGEHSVCAFRIGHNRYAKGEQVTDWYGINAWGKLGEQCAEHLSKGRQVVVDGNLMLREYEASDGSKRTSVDVRASSVLFVGPKGETGATSTAPAAAPAADDDIPF